MSTEVLKEYNRQKEIVDEFMSTIEEIAVKHHYECCANGHPNDFRANMRLSMIRRTRYRGGIAYYTFIPTLAGVLTFINSYHELACKNRDGK